ncbi:MAG: Holliday junction resolvase RuvX [Chloroflexota bacterium]
MRLLCLDVGERHIGVAISDPTGTVARPLQTVEHVSREEDVSTIAAIADEYEVDAVVVGLPLSLDGTVGPQAERVDRFREALARGLDVSVIPWDERYSTAAAEEIILKTRKEKARRRARADGEIDSIAAAVILQSYLDTQAEPSIDHQGPCADV